MAQLQAPLLTPLAGVVAAWYQGWLLAVAKGLDVDLWQQWLWHGMARAVQARHRPHGCCCMSHQGLVTSKALLRWHTVTDRIYRAGTQQGHMAGHACVGDPYNAGGRSLFVVYHVCSYVHTSKQKCAQVT